MGCDIHIYTEAKYIVNGVTKWHNIDNWRLNRYYGTDDNESEYNISPVYWGRNYELFAVLANVRGYYSDDVYTKGLPDDVSDVVKNESDRLGVDGHSHSWYTLKELYEYHEPLLDPLIESLESHIMDELWIHDRQQLKDCVEGVRIVFWFDN
jgi:hypothetical protein